MKRSAGGNRTLTESERQAILKRDCNLCQYCFDKAEEVDHIVPWSHVRDNADDNLVASCVVCNRIASNKVFDSFEDKKYYILRRLSALLLRNKQAVWLRAELEELSGRLRQYVRSNCIVVEDHWERKYIEESLERKRRTLLSLSRDN